ncbi:hypothetical protein CPB84DRAFT_1764096 [Gymnopilus junonius]|uniref:Uncharacterized protein n=1 Tax=Gymnopilus junonius TaxID=109634 RepID=A0A9P5NYH9_GYMJU|nr:hypothetical protein CPB84DRAFT_1764096 [Gymnopilus junonius]
MLEWQLLRSPWNSWMKNIQVIISKWTFTNAAAIFQQNWLMFLLVFCRLFCQY